MSILLLACGSLRRELEEVLRRHDWTVEVEYLSPDLHMSPQDLASAVESRLGQVRHRYERVVVIYGRCAPGLDDILERYAAERLPGEHCYEVFGDGQFTALLREEAGTYFLTDFLCQNFACVITGLGLDRYPRLKKTYFHNYTRVVYLDTGTADGLEEKALEIAAYLELPLLVVRVGVEGLERRLLQVIMLRTESPAQVQSGKASPEGSST